MLKGTVEGFDFEIKEELLDDWDFVDLLTEADENSYRITKLAKYMMSAETYEALKEFCRIDRRTSLEKMTDMIGKIITTIPTLKN